MEPDTILCFHTYTEIVTDVKKPLIFYISFIFYCLGRQNGGGQGIDVGISKQSFK